MHQGSDTIATLVRSVTELRAFQRYTVEVLELQQIEADLAANKPVAQLISQSLDILHSHIDRLDLLIATLGGSREALKSAASSLTGAFLNFIGKTRSHQVSKILRDDHILLNFAAVSYVMLHTSATALLQPDVAEVALQHHHDLVPLLEEIASLLPRSTLQDLSQNFGGLNRTAADATLRAVASGSSLSRTPWAVAG